MFFADNPHLFAVAVIGKGQGDVRACSDKVPRDLLEYFGVCQRHLRHELTGGQIATAFDFEEKTTSEDEWFILGEALGK